ncbi:molybdopterin molybdotransferase MoeA [Actinomycetospora lemnae]|uniref:Molybdopterin molybdenumtransferase n=1 Tax=Actinomycetospora lemnae TaxID=3019891 RepID=A0ABT5SWT5_9PSEU|nr:gephyrin-like molybdotransferase Glp [Actinomycetospora sp. DW7H6]MDD7967319.1 molybdopterin molybdotransferase MoeA [Actinomycetospora sp. DW7H6]
MRPVAEHAAAVAALFAPTATEWVPLAEARGRVLAQDLVAPHPLPPFANSAMDGYAVRSADLAAVSVELPIELPVAADLPAGRTDGPALAPGTAHRIMTGAAMPDGADAVVQVEWTDGGTERVRVDRAVEAGQNVRGAGGDVTAGEVVLEAGTLLGPAQVGLAAAIGSGTLPVRRRPRVLVLSTGSELVAPGEPLRHGQIHESNGPMLAAAVDDAGGRAELLRFVPDDVEQFVRTLDDALAARADDPVDLVMTSGGVSAGAYEVVKDAFSRTRSDEGSTPTGEPDRREGRGVTFTKVAMQPGMPQGLGHHAGPTGEVAVVTLPGNPVSSLVSFEVFVRPALRAAFGHPQPERPRVRARLAEALDKPAGRRQFRRGRIDAVAGTVAPVGGAGSHLLAALARADCLIVVDEQVTHVDAGETAEVWLLDG